LRGAYNILAAFLLLLPSSALAWSNHGWATYWAFKAMPEVANAPAVKVEQLDVFLREQEAAIQALLDAQQTWARANLASYPPLPQQLAFKADASRDDQVRRQAFLEALRMAPDTKFALFIQSDPSAKLDPERILPYSAVSTLTEPPFTFYRFGKLEAGDEVRPLSVIATASNEPDFGADINCWDDSPSEWGKRYRFGKQPFGNPAVDISSQAPFHMGFYHQADIVYRAAPFVMRTYLLLRVHQFFTLAQLAFRTGHLYWGWRFAGNAIHYVQDLTQPYHASLLPGISTPRMIAINTMAMLGWTRMKDEMIVLVSNRHLALERYQVQMLYRATVEQENAPIVKALQSSNVDATYPAWSDSYLRDVVSAEAFAVADRLDAVLMKAMPAHYVADPRFDFGAEGIGIDLLGEMQNHELAGRNELDTTITDLFKRFGAHSRNLVRALMTKAK
jgi:hypothetical protein